MNFERRKLGDILVEMGSLAPAEMRLVLERQAQLGKRFGETAIAEGLISDTVLAQALAGQFGLECVDLEQAPPPADVFEAIAPELLARFECIPIRQTEQGFAVAVADPTRLRGLDDLEML